MIENDAVRAATEQLAQAIQTSEEYRQYSALKETVMANDANRALLKEYQRTQTRLQMAAVAGQPADDEDVQRFQKLSALLYMNGEIAQYLVAQLRVRQLAGEVFQRVAAVAELELDLPGM
ncbi:MAG TPA: YlbF family regulator [Candidatus Limiplasma sp.]|nr:YlbF family regulator [Candidatus Limiplasma sp.]HPS81937.1 YlbF family regulator [Candidatus Limiplasma sp.]